MTKTAPAPVTASTILAAVAARAAAHGVIGNDILGRAVREFADHGQLPAERPLRDAVLDLELAAHLAVGGSPAGSWVQLLEAARLDPERHQQAVTRSVQFDRASTIGLIRAAVGGREAIR